MSDKMSERECDLLTNGLVVKGTEGILDSLKNLLGGNVNRFDGREVADVLFNYIDSVEEFAEEKGYELEVEKGLPMVKEPNAVTPEPVRELESYDGDYEVMEGYEKDMGAHKIYAEKEEQVVEALKKGWEFRENAVYDFSNEGFEDEKVIRGSVSYSPFYSSLDDIDLKIDEVLKSSIEFYGPEEESEELYGILEEKTQDLESQYEKVKHMKGMISDKKTLYRR